MGTLVGLCVFIDLMFRLPWFFEHARTWHRIENWLNYRPWSPCAHQHQEDVRLPPEVDATMGAGYTSCLDCGQRLFTLTRDPKAAAALPGPLTAQVDVRRGGTRRRAWLCWLRIQLMRLFDTWGMPVLRAYRYFCSVIGSVVITTWLLAWIVVGTEGLKSFFVGPPACRVAVAQLVATVSQTPACHARLSETLCP